MIFGFIITTPTPNVPNPTLVLRTVMSWWSALSSILWPAIVLTATIAGSTFVTATIIREFLVILVSWLFWVVITTWTSLITNILVRFVYSRSSDFQFFLSKGCYDGVEIISNFSVVRRYMMFNINILVSAAIFEFFLNSHYLLFLFLRSKWAIAIPGFGLDLLSFLSAAMTFDLTLK